MVKKMSDYKLKTIGYIGEKCAIKFLIKNKYKIINTNYSCKYGEIDIVCEKDDCIVFVEVKTRKRDALVAGVYAVNKRKQLSIIKTAHNYMLFNPTEKQPRFDVIEVEFEYLNNKAVVMEHFEDAFSQGGEYAVF